LVFNLGDVENEKALENTQALDPQEDKERICISHI
jgi:hypothetical protein